MAIFRKGVKVGPFDIPLGLTKGRAKGITDKLGITEAPKRAIRPEGEIDAIRAMVGKAEGFMMPVNFKITFQVPQGIEQQTWDETKVKLQDDGDGAYIKTWSYDIAQPTAEQIASYETAGNTAETLHSVKKTRGLAYPELKEQLDMQYKDLLNGTTTWKDAVAKVKSDNPKE